MRSLRSWRLVRTDSNGNRGVSKAKIEKMGSDVAGVALPVGGLKGYSVEIVNRENHFTARVPVADVGGHYTDDRKYVFGFDRPKAETHTKSRTGIDLLPQTARDLG